MRLVHPAAADRVTASSPHDPTAPHAPVRTPPAPTADPGGALADEEA